MTTFSTGPASYTGSTDVSLPSVAQSRIQHISQAGSAASSMLAGSDYLLLDAMGFEPVAAVMGLSVVHLGQIQVAGLKSAVEIEAHSQARTMGWANAMTRMRQEAEQLGADGVFVHTMNAARFDGEEHEYSVKGTALRLRSQPGALRTPSGQPFSCHCSAMLLYQYLRRGLCPVAVRYDCCVYHVPHRTLRQALGQTFQNTEVPVFTDGWYTGREIALSRLHTSLEQAGAELVLSVSLEENEGGMEHTSEFRAFGRGWRRMPQLAELIPEVDLVPSSLIDRDGLYPTTSPRTP